MCIDRSVSCAKVTLVGSNIKLLECTVIWEIFLCQKIFVPANPYRSNMHHTLYTAMKNFVHLISYITARTKLY